MFVVTLGRRGFEVPGFDEPEPVALDLARLELLQELATGSSVQAGIDDVIRRLPGAELDLRAFVAELQRRDLLLASPRPATAPDPDDRGPSSAQLDPYDILLLESTVVFAPTPRGFEMHGHDGALLARLTPHEVLATADLVTPRKLEELGVAHRDRAGDWALDDDQLHDLCTRLMGAGVLWHGSVEDPTVLEHQGAAGELRERLIDFFKLRASIQRDMDERDASERERTRRTGRRRVPITPVTFNGITPPLALGLIMANAMTHDDGRMQDHYYFRQHWILDPAHPEELVRDGPGVFLFSNYLWTLPQCLGISAAVKKASPESITIHGGPSTPKYEGDLITFFRDNPHVDVAVRGEGEVSATAALAALVGAWDEGAPDLAVLSGVLGVSYRYGDQIVRNDDRERVAELDTLPSPYLMGMFDSYSGVPGVNVTIETNRGCPYGCTFCDWGSATLSRIRKFPLDRVFAEAEWCATHQIDGYGLADANFGIFDRDVTITEKVVELKARYGYPTAFGANYAKNTVRHLEKIIRAVVDAGILTHGTLSLQSMDEETLDTIDRSNIKLERYEELATAFRRSRLPLFVDLMVGLPGQTKASFHEDLQQCLEREVHVRIPVTEMLVNSPMNDPEYRERNQIEIEEGKDEMKNRFLVVATSSFTRQDYHEMMQVFRMFLLFEDFGALRQVGRYVRQETGTREMDFYERLRQAARTEPERWPFIALTVRGVPRYMAPPISWRFFFDELRRFLVEEMGVCDDSALDTVLAVQHALVPSADRSYPSSLDLAHDYAAWYSAMFDAKDRGHREDWPDKVAHLRDYPPASLVVEDPEFKSTRALGIYIETHGMGANWELRSPVERPLALSDYTDVDRPKVEASV
jgi:radical SAM superfamily enzyme YgiQ (UPF0313 family)